MGLLSIFVFKQDSVVPFCGTLHLSLLKFHRSLSELCDVMNGEVELEGLSDFPRPHREYSMYLATFSLHYSRYLEFQ